MSKLDPYRRKRNPDRTPEPMGIDQAATGGNRFVVHEHHARALHWDLRLERDGVLVSWAVPKGIPPDPKTNRLAVHVEDHPLEYGRFEGQIGAGEYGGGTVSIWDAGSYETEKWSEREVKFVLHGRRVQGRFVLFQTGGKNWMLHRMDEPSHPDWQPTPAHLAPMLATPGPIPDGPGWDFEMKWDGVRALIAVDGGRITITSRNDRDMSASYPELRSLGESLGSTQVLLDGEIVAFDEHGRPSFAALQQRIHVTSGPAARRLAEVHPVAYLAFDLLHLDGRSLLEFPYTERRAALVDLGLDGANWQCPPAFDGSGAAAAASSRSLGLEGIVAKRRTSRYLPGRRSPDWIKIKNIRTQEVLVCGWTPGQGRRAGGVGALILGVPDGNALRYVGKVGTGFTEEMLRDLGARLGRLSRQTTPFAEPPPRAQVRGANWVTPRLVGEVAFTEWTSDGRLRHPAWRGLRPDKNADQVVRES